MLHFTGPSSPKASILMAVFNRGFSTIKRALDSVLSQDFEDFELIIADDGCDIELGRQLLEYSALREEKITYLRHKNRGQAMSINQAIVNSSAPFIGFIDSDDEYKPNHISECLSQLDKGFDLISSTTETIVTKEEDYFLPDKNNPHTNIHVDDCIVFGTLFGKREVFLDIGFNDLYSLDSDFFERAGKAYKTTKLHLKTYKYYLGGPDSIITHKKLIT